MESRRFDPLARFLALHLDRRQGAGAALALVLVTLLTSNATAKKGGGKGHGSKKHKHKKKHRGSDGLRNCDDIALEPGADLYSCDLRAHPGLASADFTNAKLEDSDLSGASLAGVSFRGAWLWRANLQAAVLTNARFDPSAERKTDIFAADFTDADLAGATYDARDVYYANYAIFCHTTMPNGSQNDDVCPSGG